jgi:tetratricopeptide (TPR) repeat protein
MKREEALLQQALTAARSKHELTARDLFLEVVEINPRNELAWTWLTGLLDDLDDCIYACERVLEINPHNGQVHQYLARLQEKKRKQLTEQRQAVEKQVKQAIELSRAGKREKALGLIRDAAQRHDAGPEGWRLLAELSNDMDEQIHALEKLLAFTPQDARARERLDRLCHLKANPQELAAIYEEQGQIEQAIEQYYLALRQPQFKKQWRSIDRKIVRLKTRRSENITHISPGISIARLAAGPPLLYFFMLLIHVGINPLANPQPVLWLEFFGSILGGFLIAFASIRSHHRLWYLLFKDVSTGGTPLARAFMGVTGSMLVLFPFIHLFYAAIQRLFDFFQRIGLR